MISRNAPNRSFCEQFASCRLVFFVLVVFSFSVTSAGQGIQLTGTTMGPIQYKVVISDLPDGFASEELAASVQAALDEVNQLMSTYIPDSDVSRFNNSESTDWFEVAPLTAQVVQRAQQISTQTEGAFDITVGPAVELWNFGPAKNENDLPTDSEVESIKPIIGFQKLEVRMDPPALRKQVAGLRIDLSAIAKGFAVDQVAATLAETGSNGYMVEVGGEVYATGVSVKSKPWRIGIEKPDTLQRKIDIVVEVQNQGVATSGDYRNFKVIDGKRYSHTIDPRTCRPVTHGMVSTTIMADDCMTADAIATAMMVMGVGDETSDLATTAKCLKFCESNGYQAYFLYRPADLDPANTDDLISFQTDDFSIAGDPAKQVEQDEGVSFLPQFLATIVIVGLAIAAMAVGAIFNNKPIAGSCGGLSTTTNADGESACSLCQKPVQDCPERSNATT